MKIYYKKKGTMVDGLITTTSITTTSIVYKVESPIIDHLKDYVPDLEDGVIFFHVER
jgi:hypothetical protein